MPRTTPPLSDLLSDTFKNVRPYYWTLVKVSLVGVLALLPATILILVLSVVFEKSFDGVVILSVLGLSILSFLLQMWVKLTGQRMILKKGKLNVLESYMDSFKLVPSLFWMLLLMSLILIPASLALLVPYLVLLIRFYFADWYIANGEARGLTALAKSRELSYGVFWQTTWKVLFPVFIVILCTLGVNRAFVGSSSDINGQILTGILNSTFSIFATPVLLQYNYELFTALKRTAKKESPKQIQFYKVLAIVGAVLMALFLALVVFVLLQTTV